MRTWDLPCVGKNCGRSRCVPSDATSKGYPASAVGGFFKTARSRPGHGEAGGNGPGLGITAIGRRGLADDRAEGAAERPQTGEADIEADIGDAAVRFAQQEHRSL